MAETFEQYQARIFSYVEGKDPRRILRATTIALAKRISGVSRQTLTTPPAKGKWSVAQILAHLSELEMLWGYRVRMILERDGVELVGMDQDVWARNSRYDRIDPRRALDTFRAIRQANLELFGSLSPRALKRRGIHSQFGALTISSIMSLMAGHDVNHFRQIEAILGKSRTRARQARGRRRRGRGGALP
ncbi:MAG: DinB family protein [Acidobacteriota bacterium]